MRAQPQALGMQKGKRVSRLDQKDDAEGDQTEGTEQPADHDRGERDPLPVPPPRAGEGKPSPSLPQRGTGISQGPEALHELAGVGEGGQDAAPTARPSPPSRPPAPGPG